MDLMQELKLKIILKKAENLLGFFIMEFLLNSYKPNL